MTSESEYHQQFVMKATQYCVRANITIVEQEYEESTENRLFSYSSYITLTGAIHGLVLITLEPNLVKHWVKYYVSFTFNEADWEHFASDVISELLNIFAGNSLDVRDTDDIQLGTPWPVTANWIITQAMQIKQTIHTEYGNLQCIYTHLEPTTNPQSLFILEAEAK